MSRIVPIPVRAIAKREPQLGGFRCQHLQTSSQRVDKLHVLTIIIVMMSPAQCFDIIYAPEVRQHLKMIERKYYSLIRSAIETQLWFEPDVETRNRKPLKRPTVFEADWELRFGPGNQFRLFYEVNREQGEVYILAIGVKRRDRLFVGRDEVQL